VKTDDNSISRDVLEKYFLREKKLVEILESIGATNKIKRMVLERFEEGFFAHIDNKGVRDFEQDDSDFDVITDVSEEIIDAIIYSTEIADQIHADGGIDDTAYDILLGIAGLQLTALCVIASIDDIIGVPSTK